MKAILLVSVLFVAACSSSPATLLAPTIITASSPVISQYHSQDALGQYTYGYNGGSSAKIESKSLDGITRGSYSYVDAEGENSFLCQTEPIFFGDQYLTPANSHKMFAGQLQTVEYTADSINGFRAAATNLPKAPISDTPEVLQAKAEHFRAFNEASLRSAEPTPITQARAAPIVQLAPQNGFAYTFNTPSFYAAPQVIQARSLPFTTIQFGIDGQPQDTAEVALAKAEHFKLVEEQKARIATAQ